MISNDELPERLRLAVGRLARRLRQQAQGGLTPSQRSVLATLHRHGPMSMGTLAEHEGISRPSTTRSVSRLASRGLVERAADPHDARIAVVGLTETGREAIRRSREERAAFLAARLRRLTAAERSLLAEATVLLDRLLEEP